MKNNILKLCKKSKIETEKTKSIKTGLLYLILCFSFIPGMSYADVSDVLTNFLGYLTGDVGKAVATLAIASVGFGCFALGKIPKLYAVSVVIGIGVIFSAKAILGAISG